MTGYEKNIKKKAIMEARIEFEAEGQLLEKINILAKYLGLKE